MPKKTPHKLQEISCTQAQRFYRQFKKKGEQVSFNPKGKWIACMLNDEPIGIVSAYSMGSAIRIKTLMVRTGFRNRGIATALLNFVVFPELKYTAFACDGSKNLFHKFGFKEKSKNENKVSYMIKDSK